MSNRHGPPRIGALNPDQHAFHEVANIFPMLSESDLNELAADIKQHGLKEGIWLFEDKIIDGRNRFLACEIAGVKPQFRHWAGTGSLIDFVLSLNLHRRHLTESQRAMVAANIANLERTDTLVPGNKDGAISGSANLQNQKTSQSQAAEKMHVSTRSVATAAKVQREAAPEVVAAVQSGAVTVSAAADIASLPKDEQVEAVAGGKEGIQAAAAKVRQEKAETAKRDETAALSIEEQIDALPLAQALRLYKHNGHHFREQASLWHVFKGIMASARAKASHLRYTKGPVTSATEAFFRLPNPIEWEGCPACKGSLRFGERADPCHACASMGFTTQKGQGASAEEVRTHAENGLQEKS